MMEDPTPLAPVPQKRPLEEDIEPSVSTPVKDSTSNTSSPLSVRSIQTPSPFKANATPNTTAPSSSNNAPASSSAQQPAKRRRLTQKEKDDLKVEKEAKAKARAEKKAQKEAEDKVKEEEKQKKADEREEKRRLKEEEQQQKEEEKAKKEEEKAKKERSQMRLNAFFMKPKTPGVSPGKVSVESTQKPASLLEALSLEPSEAVTDLAPPSPQKNIVKNAQSDYERYFLPFNVPAHTILAPKNAFMEDSEKLQAARARLDKLLAQEDVAMEPIELQSFKASFPNVDRRGLQSCSIVDVVERVNNTSDHPIDLTDDNTSSTQQPLDLLKQIPMKYLHFGEDVRPPYYGTYTRTYTDAQARRLARNPTARLRQDTSYDYDSEAEWEEPEEGEDLDSEGDEDLDDDAEDDMDGFLDDEEDPQVKRRLISGDLQPISTGICWQDGHGVSRLNDGSDAICTDFRDFSMGFLLQPQLHSIDPFSTAYWMPEPSKAAKSAEASKDTTTNGSMNPPRAPLAQRTMNGLLNTFNTPSQAPAATASKPVKAKRMIPPEQLSAFKAEIDGKDLTKIGMVEALKKVFPKLPKDAITNTLSVVAARVGPTEKEKRWVLINT